MISTEKQFEHLAATAEARNQAAFESFKLFLQLFSAIVGGAIWLSSQSEMDAVERDHFAVLANLAVALVTCITIILVVENLRSWRGYRIAQARLSGIDENGNYRIPMPKLFPGIVAETSMMLGMILAAVLFWYFNPFSIPAGD